MSKLYSEAQFEAWGREGGKSRTKKKVAAARLNGKKGGAPRGKRKGKK